MKENSPLLAILTQETNQIFVGIGIQTGIGLEVQFPAAPRAPPPLALFTDQALDRALLTPSSLQN